MSPRAGQAMPSSSHKNSSHASRASPAFLRKKAQIACETLHRSINILHAARHFVASEVEKRENNKIGARGGRGGSILGAGGAAILPGAIDQRLIMSLSLI